MARLRQIKFARINRRYEQSLTAQRSFGEEMLALARGQETYAQVGDVQWVAADFHISPDEVFASGIIGFEESEELREFEATAFSWLKGDRQIVEGASTRTLVPFAVDLRSDNRYVCFAQAYRIRTAGFASGLRAVLNAAVERTFGDVGGDWDVDLLPDTQDLHNWIAQHVDVTRLVRHIKIPNPGRSLDDDREQMRELAARIKCEEFKPGGRGRRLRIQENGEAKPALEDLLEGMEGGDVRIIIEARAGGTHSRFDSSQHVISDYVDDFGEDLELGMERVLRALADFVGRYRQGTLHVPKEGGDRGEQP